LDLKKTKVLGDKMDNILKVRIDKPKYIKQEPYVGENGIYVPCIDYVSEGTSSIYRCILTKEMFVEAYNKWIKEE
jgi:hypothetical protein